MQATMKRRAIPHAASEPQQLLGAKGQLLERGVYAHRTTDGKDLLIAIGSEGQIVASVSAPPVPPKPRGDDLNGFLLAHERWHQALGRCWIALEVSDPVEVTECFYPEFKLA